MVHVKTPINKAVQGVSSSGLRLFSGERDDNLTPQQGRDRHQLRQGQSVADDVGLPTIPFIQNRNGAGNACSPPNALVHLYPQERQELAERETNFLCRKEPEVIFKGISPAPHLTTKQRLAKTGHSYQSARRSIFGRTFTKQTRSFTRTINHKQPPGDQHQR